MLSIFYDIIEKMKGSRTLIPLNNINDINHRYEVELTDGSYLYFYCNEERYKLKYKRWWVLDKKIIIYHVFSVVANSDNNEVKKSFENKVIYITNVYHSLGNVENRKKAAIQSFIDIVGFQTKEQLKK